MADDEHPYSPNPEDAAIKISRDWRGAQKAAEGKVSEKIDGLPKPICIDESRIWDIWMCQHKLPCITASVEIGIVQALADGDQGMTVKEIQTELGLGAHGDRGIEILTDALVCFGFIKRHGDLHTLSIEAQLFLAPSSPYFWGDQLMVEKSDSGHNLILDAIRRDIRVGGADNIKWPMTKKQAVKIVASYHTNSIATAIAVANNLDIHQFGKVTHFIDLGGGTGNFSRNFLIKYPELQCTIIDLPVVCELAPEYIDREQERQVVDFKSRLRHLPMDFIEDPWPTYSEGDSTVYDTVWISRVLHGWTINQARHILKGTFNLLPPGGKVLIHEMFMNDNNAGPETTVMFSVHMLVFGGGKQRSFEFYKEMLEEIGFVGANIVPTYTYYEVICAHKPS